MAAAFSMPLLLATPLLLLVQKRLPGRRGYTAVAGKGPPPRARPASDDSPVQRMLGRISWGRASSEALPSAWCGSYRLRFARAGGGSTACERG
jgi:hypothetical protein